MNRANQYVLIASAWAAGAAVAIGPLLLPSATEVVASEVISHAVAQIIADAIPREYQRTKDWGRTRQITAGLRSSGNFFDFDIRRRKTDVNHGVWKQYHVTLVEPEETLVVRVENVRSAGPGRTASTLFVSARLHVWARAKVYERGVHIVALDAEGDAVVRLWIDSEIALESIPSSSFLPGIAVRPVVTAARMELDEFRLRRISNVSGPIARELGNGFRHLIKDELSGPKLVDQLNRTLEKRRDRLEFTPDMLRGGSTRSAARGADSVGDAGLEPATSTL